MYCLIFYIKKNNLFLYYNLNNILIFDLEY